jgi:hypothetical protein
LSTESTCRFKRPVTKQLPASAEREVKVISLRAKTCEVVENQGGVALFPQSKETSPAASLFFCFPLKDMEL